MAEVAIEGAPPPEELQAPLVRRLLAEFVGTLVFVAVGTGAATVLQIGPLRAAQALIDRITPLTQGQGLDPITSALFGATGTFGNNFGDILAVSLAFATALATLVYAFGGVSGAHFNPAVTFALAVSRRFSWAHVPLYWVVQCAGAIAGAFIVAGIYGQEGASLGGQDILFGATTVSVDTWQALLAEAFIAFLLVTAIMAVAVDYRAPKGWSGLIIGLALAGGILVTASATGGSANFARSLGPFIASLRYDLAGGIPWNDLLIYAGGPLIGAAAAALAYEAITGLELVAPAPQPGAATPSDEDLAEDALAMTTGPEEGPVTSGEPGGTSMLDAPERRRRHGPPPGGRDLYRDEDPGAGDQPPPPH